MKKLLLLTILISTIKLLTAQVTDLPWDPRDCTSLVGNCNANDLSPTGAYLATDINGTPFAGCEFGTVTDIYVCAEIVNTTGSNRPNISFAVDLYIDGALVDFIGKCVDTILGGGDTLTICAGPFSWSCGESILLDNLLLTWNSAGANPDPCPAPESVPCTAYFGSSKCRFLGTDSLSAFQASYTSTLVCPNGTNNYAVDFIGNVEGGKAPFTYAWDFGSGATPATSGSVNQSNVTYSSPGLKTATLTVIDSDNRSFVSTQTIQINLGMSVDINGQSMDTICDLASFLTANVTNGYPPYTYNWSDALGTTMSVSAPTSTGSYSVTVIDSVGCTSVAVIDINFAQVTANAGVDQTLCKCPWTQTNCPNSDSLTLTASGGTIYNWSNGQTTSILKVKPEITTSYVVTVTNVVGCYDIDTANVIVNDSPEAGITGDDFACNGGSVLLQGSGIGTYLWSTGAATTSITVNPIVATVYTLTVTSANGCINIASHTVNVESPIIACETIPMSLTSNDCQTTVCVGDNVILRANPNYITGTYDWVGPGVVSSGHELSINNVSLVIDGNYTLTYTSTNGCSVQQVFELNVVIVEGGNIGSNQIICVDGTPLTMGSE